MKVIGGSFGDNTQASFKNGVLSIENARDALGHVMPGRLEFSELFIVRLEHMGTQEDRDEGAQQGGISQVFVQVVKFFMGFIWLVLSALLAVVRLFLGSQGDIYAWIYLAHGKMLYVRCTPGEWRALKRLPWVVVALVQKQAQQKTRQDNSVWYQRMRRLGLWWQRLGAKF